ncbi:hypothetical protein RFI_11255 [Reticulomyxa filosa]|uniref:Uncharacterized protein n=1 Tax=Reticulomyxa filosa TaxID=46433 RepID=X6NIU7_RETFI|nr:hypothetical protein RFI_11255 [Reticulomyxa filosa]|eukprot:ETO25881.1 hypothetical protein RFI_11255 [Reticulomyxa filosa]
MNDADRESVKQILNTLYPEMLQAVSIATQLTHALELQNLVIASGQNMNDNTFNVPTHCATDARHHLSRWNQMLEKFNSFNIHKFLVHKSFASAAPSPPQNHYNQSNAVQPTEHSQPTQNFRPQSAIPANPAFRTISAPQSTQPFYPSRDSQVTNNSSYTFVSVPDTSAKQKKEEKPIKTQPETVVKTADNSQDNALRSAAPVTISVKGPNTEIYGEDLENAGTDDIVVVVEDYARKLFLDEGSVSMKKPLGV